MNLSIAGAIAIFLVTPSVAGSSPATARHAYECPFGNRIVFTQTPETGEEWHGGIRMKDLLGWDVYWNAGGLFTIDFMYAGIAGARLTDSATGDPIDLTDNLLLLTIKSRPLVIPLKNYPYKISGGLTFYSTRFEFFNRKTGEGIPPAVSRQAAIFITQSWYIENRHYVNLLASAAFPKAMKSKRPALYVVPGYRGFFGKGRRWSFDFEYFFMNPVELPIKTLQYLADPDKTDFYNPDRRFVSFMFWGFSRSLNRLRIEAHLGNHISFTGPIIPLLGIGWNF